MIKRLIFSSLVIVGALSMSECRKSDSSGDFVPNVQVDLNISTNLPQYSDLNFVNGWAYINGGYNGIVAVRVTLEEIKAFDRQVPYQVANRCQVVMDPGGTSCTDTCSGSQWLMLDGQVLKGPALRPLKEYRTFIDGTVLRITN